MSNHPQALKRHRQSLGRRARNRHHTTQLKNAVKGLREAVENDEQIDKIQALLKDATVTIGRVASKGVIHARTASRKTSRLTLLVNKHLGGASARSEAPAKKAAPKKATAKKATAKKATAKKTTPKKASAAKAKK